MHPRSRRLRAFGLVWALLQFALPASAALADVRLTRGAPDQAHVEEAPGRDCTPLHAADCAVCKQLSAFSIGAPAARPAVVEGGACASPASRARPLIRAPAGVTLPRAPPRLA